MSALCIISMTYLEQNAWVLTEATRGCLLMTISARQKTLLLGSIRQAKAFHVGETSKSAFAAN
jgi:hypothetical protein